tara:strand:- start:8262 stop:9788 length:1527 start_codon:yes stop_codon:yes gene_type:complete
MIALHDIISQQALAQPRAPAILWQQQVITYAELQYGIESAIRAVSANTKNGDRIAILALNNPEYIECLYAIPAAGRICVPLNTRLSIKALAEQFDELEISLVIGDCDLINQLRPWLADHVQVVFFADYRQWCRLAHDAPVESSWAATSISGDDTAWLLFTSGTTGKAKAAKISHQSLLSALDSANQGRPVLPGDRYLYPFPLFHIAAHNILHQHQQGAAVALLPSFDADSVLALSQQYQITTLSLAPTMMTLLLDSPHYHRDKIASVRVIGYGASAISPRLLTRVLNETDCDLSQGFGMTELSGSIAFLSPEQHRQAATRSPELLQSVGQLVTNVDCKIVDQFGVEVANGEAGEIIVRGPQVISSYWNNPVATADAFKHGWLHTGDIGRLDKRGNLFIVDRKKDIIISGGENIASREVEAAISLLDNVKQVAVVGMADEKWGEQVCALVERTNQLDLQPTESAVILQCRNQLASYKSPKQVVFDCLPINANGKIDKQLVKRFFTHKKT